MQRAISTNKLYITGTETDENTVSIETIAILKVKGLMQKTTLIKRQAMNLSLNK